MPLHATHESVHLPKGTSGAAGAVAVGRCMILLVVTEVIVGAFTRGLRPA